MYLSYSGFHKKGDSRTQEGCDYAYWHIYINATKTDAPDDRLGSIYGSVVGKLFEDFYENRRWKEPEPQAFVVSRVEEVIDEVIKHETTPDVRRHRQAGVLLWKGEGPGQSPRGLYANREELAADVRDAVGRGFSIIRHYRLLGPEARAEVKLDSKIDGHTLAGRADFIILRTKPHHDLVIFDGKGSRHRDKYVSREQLFWYAMLYRFQHGKLPDKLGFIFWRYDPPESIDWPDFDDDIIDDLQARALKAIHDIERMEKELKKGMPLPIIRSIFKPTANSENCRFCQFATEELCPEGFKIAEELKKKKRKRS